MGMSLDAYASFGFILDRYLDIEEVPQEIKDSLTKEEVASLTYSSVENLDGGDYLEAIIKKKYPLLEQSYPGNEYCEEMIIHVKSVSVNAYYGAEPLTLKEISAEELEQISAVATLFGKTPQWYLYPTHG